MSGEGPNGKRDGDVLHDELFFTAVRYALDELPPPARDAFEQRLLVDQEAREYLAEAVAVCALACQGFQSAVEPAALVNSRASTGGNRRAIVWTSLALAASVLLVAGLAQFDQRGDLPTADTMRDERGRQLAVAWVSSGEWVDAEGSQLGGSMSEIRMSEISGHERRVPSDDEFADENDDSDDEDGDDEITRVDSPIEPQSESATGNDWLFEAIATPQSSAGHHQEG